MSMALQARVAVLEAEVKALREAIDGLLGVITQMHDAEAFASKPSMGPTNPNGPRTMCPHCGEKPNYFLHTRSCKGKRAAI